MSLYDRSISSMRSYLRIENVPNSTWEIRLWRRLMKFAEDKSEKIPMGSCEMSLCDKSRVVKKSSPRNISRGTPAKVKFMCDIIKVCNVVRLFKKLKFFSCLLLDRISVPSSDLL